MRGWFILAVIAVLAAQPAIAQVTVSQTGRELDANYRIGSGGYNAPRGLRPLGGIAENLYVTGQVTGGRSFRGGVPYAADDQLRLTLPSQTIDDFSRDSVGLGGVLTGSPYQPRPYLSPYRTVLGPAAIEAGQTAPGTNIPRVSTGEVRSSPIQRLYESAVSEYAPLIAPGQLGGIRVDQPSAATVIAASMRPDLAVRPLSSGLFGVLTSAESQRLAAQFIDGLTAQGQQGERGEAITEPAVAPVEAAEQETPTAPPIPMVEPIPDQDIFIDMLRSLAERQAQRSTGVALPESPRPEMEEAAEAFAQSDRETQYARAVVEATHNQIILHGLAGQNPDAFNKYMALGERRLKEGQYYEAAGYYEIARDIRRDNPLASVGAGMSYLAAGEPRTAAYFFTAAMELFPPMMEVKLDFDRIGSRAVLSQRLQEASQRVPPLARQEDSGLLFLLAYMNLQLGQAEAAREWASKLEAVAGERAIYRTFAHYVLTGQTPRQAKDADASPSMRPVTPQ